MDCSICKFPAIGKCLVSRKLFCSQICQNIGYKLIGPNGQKREREEEDVDPFTQERISDLNPKDVIKIRNNFYSLPELYKWVIDMKRTRNPLTNEEFVGPETIEYIKDAAKREYPLKTTIYWVSGGTPIIRNYTNLLMIENLAFLILEVMTGSITETVMEFMQAIVKLGVKFIIHNKDILDLLLNQNNQRLIDIGIKDAVSIYYFQILPPNESELQIMKCIEIARMLGKGTDVFERLLFNPNIKYTLFIDEQEYDVKLEPGESIYNAFKRLFEDNFVASTRHDEWVLISGVIEDHATDTNTEGYFPFDENDFEGLEEDITVRIYEEYVPPIIKIEIYAKNILVEIDVEPEELLDNLYTKNERLEYSKKLSSGYDIPKNGKVKMAIFWDEEDLSEKKKFQMVDGEPNVIYKALKLLYEESGEFYQKAGPWISNERQEWKVNIEIK
jgi:hypothetical protein